MNRRVIAYPLVLSLVLSFCWQYAALDAAAGEQNNGKSVQSATTNQAPKKANLAEQQEANERAMGLLYLPEHALRAFLDMRVVDLLNSNDVTRARNVLLHDLDSHVSTLSAFDRVMELNTLAKRALKEGQQFLNDSGFEIPVTPQQRSDKAFKNLAKATSDRDRFYSLCDAAKEGFTLGKMEDARKYAEELSKLAPAFESDWNYGNAIHDSNMVLGRIALREGRIEEAKRCLLQAGKTTGSPQLGSFGPNMSLAKDLLERGERKVVLEYFELCRKFWKMGAGELDQWATEVKAGRAPEFGANLVY